MKDASQRRWYFNKGQGCVNFFSEIQTDVNDSVEEVDIILGSEGRKVKSPEWGSGGSGSPLRS